ncbi:DUF397 domain-containing protein [Actinomadura soli]|uniref:DUF397 domain-containing protein n=2 Tax=Actinomadura soli TaxID=2508997 RepID=A0A5C4JAY4_9ACTN|nr:DUF397 domain-containing protein [Actinomadura soli]
MNLSNATWRKASRSSEQGDACVELAVWRKASRSHDDGDACVELASVPSAWRKASRSHEDGDQCVEVAGVSDAVAFRDSKDPNGPKLIISRSNFHRFAEVIKNLSVSAS